MKSKNFAKKSYGTGYGKLDILKENFALQDLKKEKNILIAPSWGPDNLIKKMGIQLAKKLSNLVDNVFIRPHPLLFIEDNYIISILNELKKNYPNIKVESPWSGDNAIYNSEVLITDYSGIALEYAAIKRNKILFVDVGLKESNPNWRSYDIEPIEISIRNKLGIIVKPDLDEIIEKVIELINKKESIDIKIINSYLFSYERNCAQNTYNIIKNII